jgi:hypothetical protein
MTATVVMFRASRQAHGRDLFTCSLADWEFLQHIGITFGWGPRGTTYELPPASKIVTPALHDYTPGEPADRKVVDRDDAIEWARSLEKAKASAGFDALLAARTTKQPEYTAAVLSNLIEEFAQYAFGGAFAFTKDARD